jgi:hypothetical protein
VDAKEKYNILNIAMVKSYMYSMEYDPTSGREVEKHGYHFLKQGYIDGFLDGFTHRLVGDEEFE